MSNITGYTLTSISAAQESVSKTRSTYYLPPLSLTSMCDLDQPSTVEAYGCCLEKARQTFVARPITSQQPNTIYEAPLTQRPLGIMDHHFLVTRGKRNQEYSFHPLFPISSTTIIPSTTPLHLINHCSFSFPSKLIFLNKDSDEGFFVFKGFQSPAH